MARRSRRLQSVLARSLIVVTCLVVLTPFISLAQSGDEAALRLVVARFYEAYAKNDPSILLALWSDKSPTLASAKQSLERTFAANKFELNSLTIRKITVEDGKATVRVVVDISAVDLKKGSAATGYGKLNRTLDFVREGEGWKVWRYVRSEVDLAAALLSAKTNDDRKTLLAAEKDMLTPVLVQALQSEAVRRYEQRDFSRSIEAFELAVDLATQVDDKSGQAAALGGIGAVHEKLGDYKKGLEYFERSLRLAEEAGDRPQIAFALNNIGGIHKSQGNYTRALDYYQRALKIRQEMDDKFGMAPMLHNIGSVHGALGNLAEALDYDQRSIKLAEEMGDKFTIASSLINIGILYDSEGDRTRGLEYFQKGLKIREEINDKPGVANALANIGILHFSQGNDAQAVEYFQQSLNIAEQIGSRQLIGRAMSTLGSVQHELGNFARALEYYEKDLKIAEEMGESTFVARSLFNIGLLHRSQGNPALALEYLQKSLRIREQIGDREGIARSLAAIGDVYLERDEYAQALDLANRGAAIAEQSGALIRLPELYIVAGKAYRGLNQPEQARRSFGRAIAATEELRGNVAGGTRQEQRFFERQIEAYYLMVDLLIGQQNLTEAFGNSERAKGRALLDTLQNGRVNITRAMTAADREEEHKLNVEVNSLNIQITQEKVREHADLALLAELQARLSRARLDQEKFQINLYAAHPELKVHRGQMEPIGLDQAGTLIPDKETALLEYVVAEDKTQLFVLTKRSDAKGEQSTSMPILRVYTLNIKKKDLDNRVKTFRSRLASQDFLFHEPARELYDLLLGPARAELQGKTNLIIVPDGILWELPFQALQPAPKRFLIESAAVSYAPSLTVLLEMTRAHSAVAVQSPKLLALGNPVIGQQTTKRITSVLMDERLEPLPEAERQVKELAKLYGPQRSKIYIGPEAQEARVKTEAASYGIVHLAAHGILNDKNPMYSQVVLSQPEGEINEDGMLEAWEVMKLDLKADLVVLSACETARGKVGTGEGMIGLSWAFFVAGVPTTVASQWSVEAASTTELMVEFHRNLEKHKSKAESLRQAMLKLLKSKEYSRPFYWAGFVVVGNGR